MLGGGGALNTCGVVLEGWRLEARESTGGMLVSWS